MHKNYRNLYWSVTTYAPSLTLCILLFLLSYYRPGICIISITSHVTGSLDLLKSEEKTTIQQIILKHVTHCNQIQTLHKCPQYYRVDLNDNGNYLLLNQTRFLQWNGQLQPIILNLQHLIHVICGVIQISDPAQHRSSSTTRVTISGCYYTYTLPWQRILVHIVHQSTNINDQSCNSSNNVQLPGHTNPLILFRSLFSSRPLADHLNFCLFFVRSFGRSGLRHIRPPVCHSTASSVNYSNKWHVTVVSVDTRFWSYHVPIKMCLPFRPTSRPRNH